MANTQRMHKASVMVTVYNKQTKAELENSIAVLEQQIADHRTALSNALKANRANNYALCPTTFAPQEATLAALKSNLVKARKVLRAKQVV